VTCHHPKKQVGKINPSQRRSTQAIPAESGQSGSEQRKEVDQHDSDDDFLNHWYHNLVPLLGGLLWRCPRAKPANDCFR
jgi:hypothetical protein